MKKFLFLTLCAGALLAACSNEEKVDEPRNTAEISFTTFVNKASKGETTKDNLASMVVSAYSKGGTGNTQNTGVLLLQNQTVTRQGTASPYTWTYSPVVYWTANTDYKFAAVNEGEISGLTDQSFGQFSFTQPNDQDAGKKDIVWATQTRNTGGP